MNKVAIFSVPRSGSSWLGQNFNSHPQVVYRFQPNMAYTFPLTLSDRSTPEEIRGFYEALLATDDPFTTAKVSISGKLNPVFPKASPTTLVFKETHHLDIIDNLLQKSDTKIIGLLRSPFATLHSWTKAPREFRPDWDLAEEWRDAPKKNQGNPRNYFGYNKWKEAAQLFLRLQAAHPGRFMLMQYEKLLSKTVSTVQAAFTFCGLDLPEQTRVFIAQAESKNEQDVYSVFRIKEKDDAWKQGLPTFVTEAIMADPGFRLLNDTFHWT